MDFKEKCKNARAFIVLLAALIALLLNIKFEREIVQSLIIVIVVIVLFFIISSIAIRLIEKICNMEVKYQPYENTSEEEEADSGDDAIEE